MTNGVRLDSLHCSRTNVERSLLKRGKNYFAGKTFGAFTNILRRKSASKTSTKRNRYYLQGLCGLFLQEKVVYTIYFD